MKTLVLLILSIVSFSEAKSKKGPNDGTVSSVTAAELFSSSYIIPVIKSLKNGNVTVFDSNCNSPNYTNVPSLLTASISGQNYYVVLTAGTVVNAKTYDESYCQAISTTGQIIRVECAAREQNNGASTLSFLMEYEAEQQIPYFFKIYKCPQVAP